MAGGQEPWNRGEGNISEGKKMEIRNVRTFMMAAELKNFTKTGEAMGYSQASVTAQIKQLENQLGVRLFDRLKNGVILTQEGRNFIPYAVSLINAVEEAEHFGSGDLEPEGTLVIDTGTSISDNLLPAIIADISNDWPKLRFRVKVMDDAEMYNADLDDGTADFAVSIKASTELVRHQVFGEFSCKTVFICRSDDELASRKKVPLKEIISHPFVTTDRGENYGRDFERILQSKGLFIDPVAEFSSTTAVMNIISQRGGVTFLPEYVVRTGVNNGTFAVIDAEEDIGLNLLIRFYRNSARWVSPAMKAFMDHIKSMADNDVQL